MRSVLLIISEPDTANSSPSGWNCQGPSCHCPHHNGWPICPVLAATASRITSTRLVGIGVPSKYGTLSASPAISSAVTL